MTWSTAVTSTSACAPSSRATRLAARSLSMTASMPTARSPEMSTGMPPPPQAITRQPASTRARMAPISTMLVGSGEGTTRRKPRPESGWTTQPRAAASRCASPAPKNGPIGLAGSAGLTVTWVTTATAAPGPRKALTALAIRLPSSPCVIAFSSDSGWAGTTVVASCCSARFPTCGPFPCTMTTRQPASMTSFTEAAMAAALPAISSAVPDCPSRVKALPPRATTAVLVMGSCWLRLYAGMSRIGDDSFRIVNTMGPPGNRRGRSPALLPGVSWRGAMDSPDSGPQHPPAAQVPPAVLRSWDQAEAKIFPLVMARPEVYERALRMIAGLAARLRETCPDLPALLAAHERGADLVTEPGPGVGPGLIAAAACAMRYREIVTTGAAQGRLAALARARGQGQDWTVVQENGDPARAPYLPYQRVEAHVPTGRAVIISIELDETLVRAVHRLDAAEVDLDTGGLRAGAELGSYTDEQALTQALHRVRDEIAASG